MSGRKLRARRKRPEDLTGTPLPKSHLALALAVMVVWGSNFVVIKFALDHLPPLLLAALRFAFAFLLVFLLFSFTLGVAVANNIMSISQ